MAPRRRGRRRVALRRWPAAASGRQGADFDFDLVGARGHRVGDVPAVGLPGAGSEFLAVDAQAGVVVDRGAFQVNAFAGGPGGERDLLLPLSRRRVEREFGERVANGEGRLGRGDRLRGGADHHDLRLVGREGQRQAQRVRAGGGGGHRVNVASAGVPDLRLSAARHGGNSRLRLVAFVEEEVQVGVAPGAVRVLERGARAVESDIGLGQRGDHAGGELARGFEQRGEAQVGLLPGFEEGPFDHQGGRGAGEDHFAAGSRPWRAGDPARRARSRWMRAR